MIRSSPGVPVSRPAHRAPPREPQPPHMRPVWVVAQPTAAQDRSRHPLADPAFHHALARSRSDPGALAGVLLSEQLARRRGPGGQTVARVWAESGAEVAVVAGADPRHQANTRRLLVDGAASVLAWGDSVRELGATIACWHTILDSPGTLVPAKAEVVAALVDSGLDPMLRISVPGSSIDHPHALRLLGELLVGLGMRGYDLSSLTVCVPMPTTPHVGQGVASRLVDGLIASVPQQVRAVVVISSRDHLHLARADAGDLAQALSRRGTAWPVAHSAGDMALRAAAAWWQAPELAGGAARRFDRILELLARPMGTAFTGRPADDAPTDAPQPGTAAGPRREFDTSLFRARSLYRRPSPPR